MSDNIIISKKLLITIISSILAIILAFIGLNILINSEFYYNKTSKIDTKFFRDEVRVCWFHSHYYPKDSVLKAKLSIENLDDDLIKYAKSFYGNAPIIDIVFIDKNGYKVTNKVITVGELIKQDYKYEVEFPLKISNNEMKNIKDIEFSHTLLFTSTLEDFKKDFNTYFNYRWFKWKNFLL